MSIKNTSLVLQIAPTRIIHDVQDDFNREFPLLKLVFFNKKAISNGDYSSANLAAPNRKLGDIQLETKDGLLPLNGEMKVSDLENQLKNEFKLAAQVFRKSGNLWLETTMTDSWTLNQQISHARELSPGKRGEPIDKDYDLDRDANH